MVFEAARVCRDSDVEYSGCRIWGLGSGVEVEALGSGKLPAAAIQVFEVSSVAGLRQAGDIFQHLRRLVGNHFRIREAVCIEGL